jgi:hypothetical protein
VFDLGGAFPVDRITVELSEINTVAPVQVYARNDPKSEWRWVAAAVLYRLQQPDNSETTSPAFAVSSSPARYWKIAVDPRAGGVGAKPPTLVALWIPQALVFAARGTGPFELGYGSAQARPAALPIETLVPGFDAVTTPASFATATPGTPTVPPAMAALKQPIDAKRWLLWSALGLAAIVLAWMAYALSKQMRTPAADAKDAAASRAVGAVADSTTAGDGS